MGSTPATFSRALHFAMSNLTPETQARLQSISRFLEDIYSHPHRLSDKRIWDWGSPKSAIRNPKSETASPASAFTIWRPAPRGACASRHADAG